MNSSHSIMISLLCIHSITTTEQLPIRDQAAQNVLSYINFITTEDVLDVQSRDGSISYYLAQLSPQGIVHGIDTSQQNTINSANKYANVGNLRFFNRDITQSYSLHLYDVVTAFFALNWISNSNIALQNIMRSLKDNGLFISTTATSENNLYYQTRLEILSTDKWSNYFTNYTHPAQVYTQEEIAGAIANAGFTSLMINTVEDPFIFENRNAFIAWIKSIPISLNNLPEKLANEFINDVADLYLKKIPLLADGSVKLYLPYVMVIAKKQNNL